VLAFDYDTPMTADSNGQHVIYWQKQPGTVDDQVTVSWNDGSHVETAHNVLSQDLVIRLSAGHLTVDSGQAGSAYLPSLTL
jgi:hypothetical protein